MPTWSVWSVWSVWSAWSAWSAWWGCRNGDRIPILAREKRPQGRPPRPAGACAQDLISYAQRGVSLWCYWAYATRQGATLPVPLTPETGVSGAYARIHSWNPPLRATPGALLLWHGPTDGGPAPENLEIPAPGKILGSHEQKFEGPTAINWWPGGGTIPAPRPRCEIAPLHVAEIEPADPLGRLSTPAGRRVAL